MMWGSRPSIGVEITPKAVRFVKLSRSGTVLVKGSLALPAGLLTDYAIEDAEGLVRLLKPWVRKYGLIRGHIHFNVPTSQAVLRKIRVPLLKGKALRKVVEVEVAASLYFPFEDPVYDCVPLQDEDGGTAGFPDNSSADKPFSDQEVLILAAPRSIVSAYAAVLRASGMKPAGADLAGTALLRVTERGGRAPADNQMFLSLDDYHMDISIFHKGVLAFMRSIPLQDIVAAMEDEAVRHWQFDEVQAELSRMLNFYQFSMRDGRERVTDIWMTGAYPNLDALAGHLRAHFPENTIEVMHSGGSAAWQLREDGDAYIIALGLALRGGERG